MSGRIVLIIQALILLVVGAVMVAFYVQGRMDRYLTGVGTFQIQALVAGIVLGIVALFLILTSGKAEVCGHDHDHGHDHDGDGDEHGHHHHHEETPSGLAVTGLIILVPLVTAAILTPDAYSDRWVKKHSRVEQGVVGPAPAAFDLRKKAADAPAPAVAKAANKGDGESAKEAAAAAAGWGPYTIDDFKAQVDQNTDGEFQLDVVSIFYTGGDEEVRNVVDGLPIETIGQVMPETVRNPDGCRIRVFRLMMNCCIADARPVSIPVDFGGPVPDYKEMGWYKFNGTMSYEQWDEFTIPVLRADRMEPTEAPEQATFGR